MAFFGGLGNALKKVGGIAAKPFTGDTQSGMMPSIGPSDQMMQTSGGVRLPATWGGTSNQTGTAPGMKTGFIGGMPPGLFNPWLRRHRQLNPGGGAVSEPVMGGIGPSQGMIDRTSQRQIPSGNRFGSY